MTATFLTITEAAERTGRSESTIRRIIRSIADSKAHADRSAIEPSPAEVAAFKKKGENFTWRIREEVVMREFAAAQKTDKKAKVESGEILSLLQRELDLKNKQIEKQWDVIQSLNDRLREGNILMGSLQQRLALPTAQSPIEAPAKAPSAKVSTEPAKEVSKEKPAKKGMFGWFR